MHKRELEKFKTFPGVMINYLKFECRFARGGACSFLFPISTNCKIKYMSEFDDF